MEFNLNGSLQENIDDSNETSWREKYELCQHQLKQFKDKVSHVRFLYSEKITSYEQRVVSAEKKYDDALKKIEKLKLVCLDKDEAISALREKIIRMRHENDSLILLDEEKMQKIKEWVRENFKELIRERDQLKKERDELRIMCDKASSNDCISPSKLNSSHLYEEIFGELLKDLKSEKYLYEPVEFSKSQSSCEPPPVPARCASIRESTRPLKEAKPFLKLPTLKHEKSFTTSSESLDEKLLQLTEDKQIVTEERGATSPYYFTLEESVNDYNFFQDCRAPVYTALNKDGSLERKPFLLCERILTSDTSDTESDGDPLEVRNETNIRKLPTCASFTTQNMKQEKLEKVGWLCKQGGIIKNWKKRWFVLSDGKLNYYKRQEAMNRKPSGQIDLEMVSKVSKSSDPLSIELTTPLRTFYITADTLSEADSWLDVLSKSLRRFNGASPKPIESPLYSGWIIQTRCGLSKKCWAVIKEKALIFYNSDKLQTIVYLIKICEIICVKRVVEEKFSEAEEDFRFVIQCLKDSHPTYVEVSNTIEMDNWIRHLSGSHIKNETPFEELVTKLMNVDGDTNSPHWRSHLIVHSKSELENSLTALSPDLEKEAVKLSKSIHLYSKTPINDTAIDYHIALSQEIIQLCLTYPELQTEFYCQLIKQTTKYRSESPAAYTSNYLKSNDWLTNDSSMNTIDLKPISSFVYLQCWQLIAICSSIFLPKLKVLWLLKAHIVRNANESSGNGRYAIYCQRSLERMLQNGDRECKPSRVEVSSIIASNPFYRLYPISVPIYFVNNTYQVFSLDGSTTVDELCKRINDEIGMRPNNESGYALYTDNPVTKVQHYLQGNVKVCDTISRWEKVAHQFNVDKLKRSDGIKFMYRNRLFFLSKIHLLTEKEKLLHVFEVAQHIRCGFLVPTANNLAKLTALYSQIECGDYVEHFRMLEELMINYPDYNNILSSSMKKKIIQNVADIWSTLKGKTTLECCETYMNVVKSIPLYGSKLFMAKEKLLQSTSNNSSADVWIALYEMQIQILSKNKEIINSYDWSQVVTFGGYKQDFMLVVQQRERPENTVKRLFAMPPNRVLDLTLLIVDYINTLVTKGEIMETNYEKSTPNDDYCQVWDI